MCEKRTLNRAITWLLLITLAVLLASGVRWHAHSVEHAHAAQPLHSSLTADEDSHLHRSTAHLSIDTSHGVSADHFAAEQDLTPQGITQKSSSQPMVWFLLLAVWVFAICRVDTYSYLIGALTPSLSSRRSFFRPLLRAPPLR